MLYGFLLVLYFINCLLLIPLVLIQKSKSSMGIGSIGGGSQLLFGGSGGQDVFQKATWVLGSFFIAGSLLLALMKSHQTQQFNIATHRTTAPVAQQMPLAE
jgi:preprotein translocase subunit SecG